MRYPPTLRAVTGTREGGELLRDRGGIGWGRLQQRFRGLSAQPDLSEPRGRDLRAPAVGTATTLERDKPGRLRGWGCSVLHKPDSPPRASLSESCTIPRESPWLRSLPWDTCVSRQPALGERSVEQLLIVPN